MLKNLSILTILSILLISCQSTSKTSQSGEIQPDFVAQPQDNLEQQIVQEENFEVIQDETQAEQLSEKPEELDKVEVRSETVEVQDRVFFGYNSANISAEAQQILDIQAQWLNDNQNIRIIIEGHCDERGTREYNIALGEKRAISVKNYLENKGIQSSRMKTISYGKEKPAYFGNSEGIHAKNRRAVVVVK